MHVSCIQAGTILAKLGRSEVKNCIDGLEQYSSSYEEAGDHAAEIRRIYRMGDADFNHMHSATPRAGIEMSSMALGPVEPEGMMVDGPDL